MLFTFARDFLGVFALKRYKVNKINNVPKIVEKGNRFTSPPLAPPGLALEEQAKRGA
jgi:hypothetical protein